MTWPRGSCWTLRWPHYPSPHPRPHGRLLLDLAVAMLENGNEDAQIAFSECLAQERPFVLELKRFIERGQESLKDLIARILRPHPKCLTPTVLGRISITSASRTGVLTMCIACMCVIRRTSRRS